MIEEIILTIIVGNALFLILIDRQFKKLLEIAEGNAAAINDIWNYITKNPNMSIDDE